MKRWMRVFLTLAAASAFSSSALAGEETVDIAVGETEAAEGMLLSYGNILWQYYDVWNLADVNFEMREESSIVNYLLYYGHDSTTLKFALADLDGNGTPELVIGTGLEEADTYSVVDIFTYADGQVIHLLEAGERYGITVCQDGILHTSGSGGAAHNYQEYLQIGGDGKSLDTLLYYYINGEEQTVEDVDGNITPFDNDYEQYMNLYETAALSWETADESSIARETGEREAVGEPLTQSDIVLAPLFKKGVCTNGFQVYLNYCQRTMDDEAYRKYQFSMDYEEEDSERDTVYVRDEAGELVSTAVIDLKTGEAAEEQADGTLRKVQIF